MSLAILRAYLEIAFVLAVGLALASGARAAAARFGGPQPARPWARFGRLLLVASLALPLFARAFVRPDQLFPAPVQIWPAETVRRADASIAANGSRSPALGSAPVPGPGHGALDVLAAALVTGSALGLAGLLRDRRRLKSLCGSAIPVRRSGRLRVCVSEQTGVPFSAWTGGRAIVVLPDRFVTSPGHWRVALAHELAHVRGGDLLWTHLTALVRALLPWHPAAALWGRWLARMDELACDERVLGRGQFSPRSYGDCLLWAAETAPAPPRAVPLAASMLDRSRTFLERRIAMILDPPVPARRSFVPAAALAAIAVLGLTAAIARGAVADRRLGSAEVEAIADDLARATGFRVTVDETVVDEVNLVLSRPESRARFREGLTRLASYRPIAEEALRKRGLPIELIAIPQTESRVQPLPESLNRMRSAGIWQFIPSTARRYGLRVDATIDERLDPTRSAEAAAAMLSELQEDLHDWRLVIAAYNAGPAAVKKAALEHGTSDAVALAKAGGVSRYASAVLAAALLIHRPDVLE